MIQACVRKLFDAYIAHFAQINSEGDAEKGWQDHREYFKWIAAYYFFDFDFSDTTNYVQRLKELRISSSVLIDTSSHYPFSALIKCAEKEGPDAVRDLFLHLFEDDNGDLKARQAKIDAFIRDSNAMAKRNGLGGYVYENSQSSAMAFLALKDPEHNCLLRTSLFKKFASRVGFADDWGTLDNFKLDVFYRFCDEIVDYALNYNDLVRKNSGRYEEKFTKMHDIPKEVMPSMKGKDRYLLVFDIIYCAETYGFANICPADPELERKIQLALFYQDALRKAEQEMEQVIAAENYWKKYLVPGLSVAHTVYGDGTVEEVEKKGQYTFLQAAFPQKEKRVSFWFDDPKLNTYLSLRIPGDGINSTEYRLLLCQRATIEKRLQEAQLALEPYKCYLD